MVYGTGGMIFQDSPFNTTNVAPIDALKFEEIEIEQSKRFKLINAAEPPKEFVSINKYLRNSVMCLHDTKTILRSNSQYQMAFEYSISFSFEPNSGADGFVLYIGSLKSSPFQLDVFTGYTYNLTKKYKFFMAKRVDSNFVPYEAMMDYFKVYRIPIARSIGVNISPTTDLDGLLVHEEKLIRRF